MINENKTKTGKRISELREKAGYKTIEKFADELGYSRQTVAKWENGNAMPTLDQLCDIVSLLECDIGYLLCLYDTRYFEHADICKTTGLSEEAVNVLVNLQKRREHSDPSYYETLSAEKLKFISYLIENENKFTSAVMDTLSHLNSDLNSEEYRVYVDFFLQYKYWSEKEFMKMQEFYIYDTYLELVKSYLKDKELQRDTK